MTAINSFARDMSVKEFYSWIVNEPNNVDHIKLHYNKTRIVFVDETYVDVLKDGCLGNYPGLQDLFDVLGIRVEFVKEDLR